jgi:hypothetical protein
LDWNFIMNLLLECENFPANDTDNVTRQKTKNAMKFDNSDHVTGHLSNCLARIFLATYKVKIKAEIEKFKVLPEN